MYTYYMLLGSNKGERKKLLDVALTEISIRIGNVINQSSYYETEPWGLKEQDFFLNLAIQVNSEFDINKVLEITKGIEKQLDGAKEVKWGPRSIDIDILYCDDLVINTDKLTIPHAQLYQRNFVLIPMIEIAGDFIDPVKKISLDEIFDECTDDGEVFLYED